jgi:dolichol kinase
LDIRQRGDRKQAVYILKNVERFLSKFLHRKIISLQSIKIYFRYNAQTQFLSLFLLSFIYLSLGFFIWKKGGGGWKELVKKKMTNGPTHIRGQKIAVISMHLA